MAAWNGRPERWLLATAAAPTPGSYVNGRAGEGWTADKDESGEHGRERDKLDLAKWMAPTGKNKRQSSTRRVIMQGHKGG